jgi:glycolate oxidase FAD binding subunit
MVESGSVLGSDALLAERELPAWSVAGLTPSAVLRPRSSEEIAAALQEATRTKTPIEPAGGGTWLRHGRRPDETPVVLSTARLQQIIEYEPADLVISVEAGATLAKVQETVARERQMVALDPPAAPSATIGALVSLADAGPLRLGYGTPRDQVLGLQIVTGDGRIVDIGGKVVKNVAGYDLTRLLVGSRGLLGIITQVHLRLRPLPAQDATFSIEGTPAELCALLPAVLNAAFEPAAAELIVHPTTGDGILLVRVQGNAAALDAASLELRRITGNASIAPLTAGDDKTFWQTLSDTGTRAVFAARLALLPDQAAALLHFAERFRPFFPRLDVMLHGGSGIARLYADASANSMDGLVQEIVRTRNELASAGGTLLVPVMTPELQGKTDYFEPHNTELHIQSDLKKVFDPAFILSRHRWAR